METAAYRLNEYQIIKHENGLLGWETHYGFGAQQHGMCFIHNDILIIGPCSHEEVGYLKGEFLDRIEKLPLWNRIHLPPGPKLRKPSWPLSREGISWFKWLVPAADLISGFISRLLPAKERSHVFRSSDRHRRK